MVSCDSKDNTTGIDISMKNDKFLFLKIIFTAVKISFQSQPPFHIDWCSFING